MSMVYDVWKGRKMLGASPQSLAKFGQAKMRRCWLILYFALNTRRQLRTDSGLHFNLVNNMEFAETIQRELSSNNQRNYESI